MKPFLPHSLSLLLSLSLYPSIFSGVPTLYLSHILFVEHSPILSPFGTLSYIPFLYMHPLALALSHSTNIFSQSLTPTLIHLSLSLKYCFTHPINEESEKQPD